MIGCYAYDATTEKLDATFYIPKFDFSQGFFYIPDYMLTVTYSFNYSNTLYNIFIQAVPGVLQTFSTYAVKH